MLKLTIHHEQISTTKNNFRKCEIMQKKGINYRPTLLISLIFFFLFCTIAFGVQSNAHWINSFDQFITHSILSLASEKMTAFFVFITRFGGVPIMAILVLLFSFFVFWKSKKLKLTIWYILQSILGAGALNVLVKLIFQRERPTIEHLIMQGGFSFPSGHAMGSMICYGGLAFLIFHLYKKSTLSFIILVATLLLVLFIGLSRIYVGVHFPSDIIGGYLLGASWLTLMIALFPKLMD
ncbi:phosphatase PAP2 family protein [Carnobacterium sp. TMP28]|uniref:phosphatase PAP2 family protein n=1 Tax=Carnobacterium sp. TMP28 TaxID=3397060 RepID=UPI0039E1834F